MKSYGQYCALAKTLDVVGSRWTMLIIRELNLQEQSRYTDLRRGLPGITTNLLAERLRELEAAGVVARRVAPPPIATTVFELTERGRDLVPALEALTAWGVPYMVEGPKPGDEYRSRWLAWPARAFLEDHAPEDGPTSIEVRVGDDPVSIGAEDGHVTFDPHPSEEPAAIIAGDPHAVLGILTGAMTLEQSREAGVTVEGDVSAITRLQPNAA
jgi:DNA-binding HxlR family transcriptional regulator